MKNQIQRASKIILFCHQSKNKKVHMLYMRFSSTPNTNVQQVSYLPISKLMPLILLPPLFQPPSQVQVIVDTDSATCHRGPS